MKPVNRLLLVMVCVLILIVSILVGWGIVALPWAEAVVVGGVITVVGLSRGRMSSKSNQGHLTTSPTTSGMPRLDWGNIHQQPMAWFFEIDATLFTAGIIISSVSPSSSAWSTVGFLLILLSAATLLTFPGALLALRHPSGAFPFPRLDVERRFTHPRLVGLTLVWAGLVVSGLVGAILYLLRAPFSNVLEAADGWRWLLAGGLAVLAVFLVGVAPLLALFQFDRRR